MATVVYLVHAHTDINKTSPCAQLLQLLQDVPTATLKAHTAKPEVWRVELPTESKHLLSGQGSLSGFKVERVDGGTQEDKVPSLIVRLKLRQAGPSRPSLLTLPPEMRNRIYRFALLAPEGIIKLPVIGHWPSAPSLLQTCHQIRTEASAIYYTENEFNINIARHDATRYIKWHRSSPHRRNANQTFYIHTSCHWDNLERWAEARWRRECEVPASPARVDDYRGYHHVFEVVDTLRGYDRKMPWGTVKRVLGESATLLSRCFCDANIRPRRPDGDGHYLIHVPATTPTSRLRQHFFEYLELVPSAKLSCYGGEPAAWVMKVPVESKELLQDWLGVLDLGTMAVEDEDRSGDDSVATSTPASAPAEPDKPSLLTLPPEMRNRIYRFTLIEETQPVSIAASDTLPNQPGLLRTCRQIRHESADIYYQENEFEFDIEHNNAAVYIRWCTASPKHLSANYVFSMTASTNWPNALVWLEAVHSGRCVAMDANRDGPDGANRAGSSDDAVAHLSDVVVTLGNDGLAWKQVHGVLKEVRRAIGALDPGWLDEGEEGAEAAG
ncbi:hypothetical protein LTR85_006681 [Meristemomyces frigidus]|nr:hypothetical protein LTR85_006681 [Meristemomyces frigidus]